MAIINNYEAVIVFSLKNGEESAVALLEKFKSVIEKYATSIENVDVWGKRRLAYLINKEAEGYYVLINFTSDAEFPAELDRRFKITDGILRTLIVKK